MNNLPNYVLGIYAKSRTEFCLHKKVSFDLRFHLDKLYCYSYSLLLFLFFQTQLMMESIMSLHEKVWNWHCSFGIFTWQTSLFDVNYLTWILKEKFPLRFLWILKRLMWCDELSSIISWITVTCYKTLIKKVSSYTWNFHCITSI